MSNLYSNSTFLTPWIQTNLHFIIQSRDINTACKRICTNLSLYKCQYHEYHTTVWTDLLNNSSNRPISPISQCTHQSPTMHHPQQKWTHFRSERCTAGPPTGAQRDPWNRSIYMASGHQQSPCGIFKIMQHICQLQLLRHNRRRRSLTAYAVAGDARDANMTNHCYTSDMFFRVNIWFHVCFGKMRICVWI